MSTTSDNSLLPNPAEIADWLRRDRERRQENNITTQVQLELPKPPFLPLYENDEKSESPQYNYNTGVNCGIVVDLLG